MSILNRSRFCVLMSGCRGAVAAAVLAFRSLVRTHVLTFLCLTSVAIVIGMPYFLRSDGTVTGERQLMIQFVLSTVFGMLAIADISLGCGFFARERNTKRLALTLVRPVPRFAVFLGNLMALAASSAIVLTVACVVLYVRLSCQFQLPASSHVIQPVMPSPYAEAEIVYEQKMKDPAAAETMKNMDKAAVISLLAAHAFDRYDIIDSGKKGTWTFSAPDSASGALPSLRFRFSTGFGMRASVTGEFVMSDAYGKLAAASLSNLTLSVIHVPLCAADTTSVRKAVSPMHLVFKNTGKSAVMIRPRRDMALLMPADSFIMNLVRTALGLLAVLLLLSAFGLFLSSAFSRPVAIFTATVIVIVILISPSVSVLCLDAGSLSRADKIGLTLSRGVANTTRHISGMRPIEALSSGECIEWSEVGECWLWNAVLAPMILLIMASMILRSHVVED